MATRESSHFLFYFIIMEKNSVILIESQCRKILTFYLPQFHYNVLLAYPKCPSSAFWIRSENKR